MLPGNADLCFHSATIDVTFVFPMFLHSFCSFLQELRVDLAASGRKLGGFCNFHHPCTCAAMRLQSFGLIAAVQRRLMFD